MEQEQVKRMLADYRRCAARRECLRIEMDMAREQIEREREAALENAVLPGRGIEMPPGGEPGDPTARVAVKYASGYEPVYIREMEADLNRMRDEMRECETVCRYVDVWRGALNERERLVIDRHMIGGETYAETLEALAAQYPACGVTSVDGIKCLNRRAMEKIYAAAGAETAAKK